MSARGVYGSTGGAEANCFRRSDGALGSSYDPTQQRTEKSGRKEHRLFVGAALEHYRHSITSILQALMRIFAIYQPSMI